MIKLKIVIGLLIVAIVFIFFEPWFLPTWGRWAAIVALAILATLGCITLFAMAALPADLHMIDAPESELDAEILDLVGELEQLGYVRIGPPRWVNSREPLYFLVVPLLHTSGRIYGAIHRTRFPRDAATIGCDLSSTFGKGGELITTTIAEYAPFPMPTRWLAQVIFGAGPNTAHMWHEEALKWLQSQGFHPDRLTAANFDGEFAATNAQVRSHFLRHPFRNIAVALYRAVRGRSPHCAPLEDQPLARRWIEQMRRHGA